MAMTDKEKRNIEKEIVDGDAGWNERLLELQAQGAGLTVEQYKVFQSLKTEEEMRTYMEKHSTKLKQ